MPPKDAPLSAHMGILGERGPRPQGEDRTRNLEEDDTLVRVAALPAERLVEAQRPAEVGNPEGDHADPLVHGAAPSAQSSPASPPSSSGPPFSRNFSAISPALARIAFSIWSAISGLSRRNALAFSRPWPRRWLS